MSSVDVSSVPTIDLSLFDIGDPWRDHVAAQIDSAAHTRGVFQILGHGVDVGLLETLLELGGKYLHRLPRSERAVPDLPEFQDTVREYTTAMTGLGHKLMAALARGLRLDDGFFADNYTGNPTTALRIGGYPVTPAPTVGRPYVKDAADRGLLTIAQPGGPEGGQQVRLDGRWIDVPPLPGALLCCVEPMLERLTHGHYVSAAHRLSLSEGGERPSLSFIFAPAPGAVLTPLAAMRPRATGVGDDPYVRAARF
jgi:isopenicillin N synthase-like dioxygenase